jgi:hypothetical protein
MKYFKKSIHYEVGIPAWIIAHNFI